MNRIIAISGLKNSGKDTAAKMLQYLLNTPKWLHSYWCYNHLNFIGNTPYKIKSFAHPIKEILSILLHCPIEQFNNRDFKENYYVSFPECKIYNKKDIPSGSILNDNKFSKLAKNLDPYLTANYWISIRQLMQFFGTNVMRTFFGDSLWTYNILQDSNTIISDLRFKIEMDAIKKCHGYSIYINRPECIPGAHASEQEVIDMKINNQYDYIIENNGTLKDLFYKLKQLI